MESKPIGKTPQKPDDTLHIEAVWESAYEQVVRPEKVIALNAYFIRHLQLIGPELGWMYIGFRQAAYSAGGRSGQRTARFSGKTIASLSGSSERTFWNRAARPETWQKLDGLVTLVDEKPLWDEKSQTPKRLPRKYAVAMTLPLTGADTYALTRWITGHIEQYQGAAGVLAAACETPIDELLAHPETSGEVSQPLTVHRLVRDLFSANLPEQELQALAERLHLHIMPPGDLLVLTLFFVEHILSHLGTGPGWLLTILRDRCWIDPQSGISRSQVTIQGGYAEMAGWLGLSRPMTIYEWLREPVLQIYLHYLCNTEGTGEGEVTKWNAGRVFDVLMEEVPVEIIQMTLSGVDPVTRFTVSDVDPVTRFTGSNGVDVNPGVTRFTVSDADPVTRFAGSNGADVNPGVTQIAQPGYVDFSIGVTRFTVSGYADFSIVVTQIAHFSYAICRVFKLLSSLKPALKTLLTTTTEKSENLETPAPEMQKPVVVVDKDSKTTTPTKKPEQSELDLLFHANAVSKKKQKQLLNSGATLNGFTSWILYGFTPEGKGLTNLVGNAIQSTLDSPETGAGGVCDVLAGYGLQKLTDLLKNSICGTPVTDQASLSVFRQLTVTQKQDLLMRLGQKPVDVPKPVEPELVYEKPAASEADAEQIRDLLRNRAGKPNSAKHRKGY